jgi:indole-3-glycerol phosphate synthase
VSDDETYLSDILTRKQEEVRRRRAHVSTSAIAYAAVTHDPERGRYALRALSRDEGAPPKVIAEVKFRSPSRGEIRERTAGEAVRVARAYEAGGAAAISVLADRLGFGGSPLDVRRVARAVRRPVLFKGFVLDETQIELARACGASLVLLLVRALDGERLSELVDATQAAGMEPVVEAANADEVDRALATKARIVGVNARDLATFEVDPAKARDALDAVPIDRIAVFMSGIKTRADFDHAAGGRADAVLIGEGLMRAEDPGEALRGLLGEGG